MKNNRIDFEAFEAEKHRPEKAENGTGKAIKRGGNKKKLRIIIAVICAVLLLLIAAVAAAIYPILSTRHNPDRFIEAYVQCVTSKDWNTAYRFLPSLDSPFITQEGFVQLMSESSAETLFAGGNVQSYVIEREKEKGNKIYYCIDYVDGNGEWNTEYVAVKTVKDGIWKYDDYRIVPGEKLMCSAEIYTPAGARLFLDGTEIENKSSLTETDPKTGKEVTACVFSTDYMFCTEHQIKVQCEGFEDYEETVQIDAQNNTVNITLTMSEEQYNSLFERAKKAVEAAYDYAGGGEAGIDESELSAGFAGERVEEFYSEIKSTEYADNKYLTVSDFSITSAESDTESGGTEVSYNSAGACYVNFEFNYTYTLSNSFDGASEKRSDTGRAGVKFVYENAKWVVDDIAVRAIF